MKLRDCQSTWTIEDQFVIHLFLFNQRLVTVLVTVSVETGLPHFMFDIATAFISVVFYGCLVSPIKGSQLGAFCIVYYYLHFKLRYLKKNLKIVLK